MNKIVTGLLIMLTFLSLCTNISSNVIKKAPTANNYYFATSGNDVLGTGSIVSPWKSIAKFNSVFASKLPGDNFLFNRGDVFYGSMIVSRSGTSGNPMTIGAYGSGANPIITGLTDATGWSNLGLGIWESTVIAGATTQGNMLVIDGVNTPMGRFPNTGWLTYTAATTNTSITCPTVNAATTNWTGAELVIRKVAWITDRGPVTGHSGSILTYITGTVGTDGNGNPGCGFFIQSDKRTLDQQNEWYYNHTTKKIDIFSASDPTSMHIQLTTIDSLVRVSQRSFITFDGVDFKGSNKMTMQLSGANITIQNCNFDYAGQDCIWGGQNLLASPNFIFQNNTINHTNSNAVILREFFTNVLIQNNLIKNSGIQNGMSGRIINGNGLGRGIEIRGSGTVQYNEVDSSGYAGISVYTNDGIVQNNLINYCLVINGDGGGIYTVSKPNPPFTGIRILNNIVLNAKSDNGGLIFVSHDPINVTQAEGIYLDDYAGNIEVGGNSTANCDLAGLLLHNTTNMNVHDNTFYNSGRGVNIISGDAGNPVRTTIFTNNIVVSKASNHPTFYGGNSLSDISSWAASVGDIDNNCWARPIDDNTTMGVQGSSTIYRNLTNWTLVFGYDAHSHKSPVTIPDTSYLRFDYNASLSPVTVALPYRYEDVNSVIYNGTITLQPYTSAVLMRIGNITGGRPPQLNDYKINHNNLPH